MNYTLHLPLPPNLANSRMHHITKHQAKKAYWAKCDRAVLLGSVPRPTVMLDRAWLYADLSLGRSMDPDNLVARLKWAIDWVVVRKYLVDDDAAHLRIVDVRQFAPVPKLDRGVKLYLEDHGGD